MTTAARRQPEPIRLSSEPWWTVIAALALVLVLVVLPVAILAAMNDGFDADISNEPSPPLPQASTPVTTGGPGAAG
ncbi:MAG TPA: hypothetical protein VFI47_15585 [Acidimicrobiales bacterium]|nr:hypothetical protein [Acidimicrobiales bacterium]